MRMQFHNGVPSCVHGASVPAETSTFSLFSINISLSYIYVYIYFCIKQMVQNCGVLQTFKHTIALR